MPTRKTDKGAADDDTLWARAMRDTAPLKRRGKGMPPGPPSEEAADREPAAPSNAGAGAARGAGPTARRGAADEPTLPPLAPRQAPGLDRRTAERLRKGQIAVEARLDLHGHTQAEAHRALVGFVAGSAAAGRRCVLVITGKGTRGAGVLRASVPAWLNDPALRPKVLAFAPARPRDGGEGALYVLLRRARREDR
jgi:DNA-nicking Smr family endonuclease